jgi:hypothetical protein
MQRGRKPDEAPGAQKGTERDKPPQTPSQGTPHTDELNPANWQNLKEYIKEAIRVLRQSDGDTPGRDEAIHALTEHEDFLERAAAKTEAQALEIQHNQLEIQHNQEYIRVLEDRTCKTYPAEQINALIASNKQLIAIQSQKSPTNNLSRPLGYAAILKSIPTQTTSITVAPKGETKEKRGEELLKEVKMLYSGAIAIKSLPSGDAKVFFANEEQKTKALSQPANTKMDARKESHWVAVDAVPMDLPIAYGENNTIMLNKIQEANHSLHGSIRPDGVRWISTKAAHERKIISSQKKSTILLMCPTKAMQEAIVRRGIVIGHEIMDAKLYHKRVNPQLCFNCGEWGHPRIRCSKKTQCGKCAGAHDTNSCISDKNSCRNCGKPHPVWNISACKAAMNVYGVAKLFRQELEAQTIEIRTAKNPPTQSTTDPAPAPTPRDGFILVQNRKRARSPGAREAYQGPTEKRGPGRPPGIRAAAEAADQSRLTFASTQSTQPHVDLEPQDEEQPERDVDMPQC